MLKVHEDTVLRHEKYGETEINGAGSVLEGIAGEEDLICMNDLLPTYRSSHCVIDLFLIRFHMNRKIRYCQTLTQENIRSDHVSVIMDLDDSIDMEEKVVKEKYSIRKADWQNWEEVSEEKFREWNMVNHVTESIDQMIESLMGLFHESMDEAVPKVIVKEGNRRRMALWTNEEVKNSKAKSEWTENICMKINDYNNPKEIWQNLRALTSFMRM